MKNSSLLTAVLAGKWFILPQFALAQKDIVDKLLTGGYSDPKFLTLRSEREKIQFSIAGASAKMSSDNSFDTLSDNSTAIFNLSGTMLKYGTYCSYGALENASAMREAISHPKVGSLIIDMDSGGGSVDAIAPYLDVIAQAKSMGKPVIACVDLCASAAYFVACHCDEIVANNAISSEIGSIGVMMGFRDNKKQLEINGITDHVVYSTLSDWKNKPFRNAMEGGDEPYALLQSEELDPLARTFQSAVKATRPKLNLEIDGIISGRMFFANQAKEYGLIDHVGDMNLAIKRAKTLRDNNIINSYLNK